MKILKPTLCFIMLTGFFNFTLAATEFEENIPLELAKILLGFPFSEDSFIYSDILENFPEFELPADFSVLGSLDQGRMQRVVLRTEQAGDLAQGVILASLESSGWQQIQAFMPPQSQTGFVGQNTPVSLPVQLCHDDFGSLTLMMNSIDSGTTLSLIRTQNNFGAFMPTCAEQSSQQQVGLAMMRNQRVGLIDYMPRLELPELINNNSPTPFLSGNMSSSGSFNDYESRSTISIDWSLSDLYMHFFSQITDQDWLLDISSTGGVLATGGWQKTISDDLELIGILSIIEISEANFEMRFRVVRQNATNSQGGLSGFSVSPF